jgi:hypothetical protein
VRVHDQRHLRIDQLTIAKLPLANDLDDFQFEARQPTQRSSTTLPRWLFAQQRNAAFPAGAAMGARSVLELMRRLGL